MFLDKKKTKAIKDKYLKIENYYQPVGVNNFWSNNYIEYENNGDRNKILSVEDYLNKIRPYLKDIINDL